MEKKKGKNCDCALGPNPPGGPSNPIPAQPNTLTRAHLTTGARPSGVKHAHVAHSPHCSARPAHQINYPTSPCYSVLLSTGTRASYATFRAHVETQSSHCTWGPTCHQPPRGHGNRTRAIHGELLPRLRRSSRLWNHSMRQSFVS